MDVLRASVRMVSSRRPRLHARALVLLGVVCLAAIAWGEQLRPGPDQGIVVGFGFFGLAFVSAVCLVVLSRQKRLASDWLEQVTLNNKAAWRLVIVGLLTFGTLIAQTWFRVGTVIAGGDIAPPIGTAWIKQVFATSSWSGSNLGGPAANEVELPFALLDEIVHLFGGSGALAQRLWLTVLIAAILASGAILARSLRMSPLAGLLAGLFFFFNPVTISLVGDNDVFLLAMALSAILPALVVSYGIGSIRRWQLVIGFVLAAPFVGFVFENAPLLGMLALMVLMSPLVVLARFGRHWARRAFMGALMGGLVCGAFSSYWFIPPLLSLSTVNVAGYSSLSSLIFTYQRSSLANALWLNSSWAWSFAIYFPFAQQFRQFPLVFFRSLVPLSMASVLCIGVIGKSYQVGERRLVAFLALLVMGVMFLSLGIKYPGAILFDVLFRLPEGWLLQDPQRFLISAALGLSLLLGFSVDALIRSITRRNEAFCEPCWSVRCLFGHFAVFFIMLLVVAGSFPLATGAVIPGARDGFPSDHVVVPGYWQALIHFLNARGAPQGTLTVLPVDDFYQMPYTWYYGTDSFIVNALDRRTLDVVGGGYGKVNPQLRSAVVSEQRALLNRRWVEASRLLDALGSTLVLVRGDVESSFPDRNIANPRLLYQSIAQDRRMRLVRSFGPLALFELRKAFHAESNAFATADTSYPNLAALGVLPRHVSIIDSAPIVGHYAVLSIPPLDRWRLTGSVATTTLKVPNQKLWTVSFPHGLRVRIVKRHVAEDKFHGSLGMTVSLGVQLGRPLVSDESLRDGAWGAVGNCDDVGYHSLPRGSLEESVLSNAGPGGSPALLLSAKADGACATRNVSWHDGAIDLSFDARSVQGDSPAMCLWVEPMDRCAGSPPIVSAVGKGGWSRYSDIINPPNGTKSVTLFLYAYSSGSGKTIDEYSHISVLGAGNIGDTIASGASLLAVPKVRVMTGRDPAQHGFSSSDSLQKPVLIDGLRTARFIDGKFVVLSNGLPLAVLLVDEVIFALVCGLASLTVVWWDKRTS